MPPAKLTHHPQPQPTPPDIVDPIWLLKAAAAVLAFGLLCAYITLCAFFYNGQWEFVLHPSRIVTQTPASLHLAFSPVRFAPDVSGQPQLTGWWIPSDTSADPTVLMLHGETGSMSDALPAAKALHDARLNVLLFDYRGYGHSAGLHPTQSLMQNDAASALHFLEHSQHISPSALLVYGANLGASLAVKLCSGNPNLAGLILESADGDTLSRVQADQRTRLVPMGMLFHERFPLADPLSTLPTPKLLLSHEQGRPPLDAERAADPKFTVELGSTSNLSTTSAAVQRFLDTYVQHPPPLLVPNQPH